MKGVMMKIGQMASYVDDGLSPAVRRTLARLQDSVPPMSPQLAAEVVEAEAQRGCHRPRDSCRQGSARSPGTGDQRIGHLGAPR